MSVPIQMEEEPSLRKRQKEEEEEKEEGEKEKKEESKKLIKEIKEEIKYKPSKIRTLIRWIFSTNSFPGQEYFAPYSSLVNFISEIQTFFYLRKLEKTSTELMHVLEYRFKPTLASSRQRLNQELAHYDHLFQKGKKYLEKGNNRMASQIIRDLSQKEEIIKAYQTEIRLVEQIIEHTLLEENTEMLLSGIIQFAKISSAGNQVGMFERSERKLLNKFNKTSDLIQVFERFSETIIEEGRVHRTLTSESYKTSSQEMKEESEEFLSDFYSSKK